MLATACFDGPIDEKGGRGAAGTEFFLSGQRYTGQYLLENQHGRGAWLHPNGCKYLGYLYAGAAEFCGRMTCPSGAEYQGVFSSGQPHGPGQVTYPHGARDAGIWSQGRLLRLLSPSRAGVKFDLLLTGHYIGWYDRRVLHVEEPESQLVTVLKDLDCGRGAADCTLEELDQLTNLKLRDRRTAGFPSHRYNCPERPVAPVRMLAWNDTDALCDAQMYSYRTEKTGRVDPEVVSVCVEELLRSRQSAQPLTGRLELASHLLLHASALDRADVIRLLLRTVHVSADVMDSVGVTGLILAAMRGHAAAVNTLLDHGANVNHVTDDGLSALSLCLSLHYPDFATKYHLDRLTVFTYPDMTEEFADVIEWLGGAGQPFVRGTRVFPTRPTPVEKRSKTRRRTRARGRTGVEDRPESPPDIRLALVPGPLAGLEPGEPVGPAGPRPGLQRSGRPATASPRSKSPADQRASPAPKSSPRQEAAPGSSPRQGSAATEGSPRRGSELEGSVGQSSALEGSVGQSSALEGFADQSSALEGSAGQSSALEGPVGQTSAADGAVQQRTRPECVPNTTTPADWVSGWPAAGAESPRASPACLDSARTDGGGGASRERMAPTPLRACPSLDRVLGAAPPAVSAQETAVRLIETFCSGVGGDWRDTEYSTPSPGTVDILPMIKLLLRRGASPETSKVPYPAVHHALLAADRQLLVALLTAGGDPNSRLSHQLGGLAPLHVSCALPGEDAVKLTALLLARGADPNVTSDPGEALLNREVLESRQLAVPQPPGARRPLHVVCSRPATGYKDRLVSRRLMDLLERAGADTGALCNGHTPVTLAVAAGDLTLAVDLLTRGADALRPLGPPHHDALGLAVSPGVETCFEPDDRKQLIRTLLAYGCDLLRDYPLAEENQTGNILEFATWVNNTDDNLLTASPHQLRGAQRTQKKQREAFLEFLGELLSDELKRHEQMAPLVNEGLFEQVGVASAEAPEPAAGPGSAAAAAGEDGPAAASPDGTSKRKRGRKDKRKRLLLSAECFCPLCDHVLGKCPKSCPNYGQPLPKLMSSDLLDMDLLDEGESNASDLLGSSSDDEAAAAAASGRQRRKRRAAADDGTGSSGLRVQMGALVGDDGKPLKCTYCNKAIRRRKVLCSACKQVVYCSKQCRANDWDKEHSHTCPARSQISLARLQGSATSQAAVSAGGRLTSGGSSHKKRLESAQQGDDKTGKKKRRGKADGGSPGGDGGGGGRGSRDRQARSRGPGGRRGRSLESGGGGGSDDAGGGGGGRGHRARGSRSLDVRRPTKSGLTPMKMPPGLADFLGQFQGFRVGECRHLVLGEWYEDDCKTKQNYSFI